MGESSPGVLERVRERIHRPQEVKFDNELRMVASIYGPEPSIRLYRNKEIVKDLKSFAPEGTVIKVDPKGKWGVNIGNSSSQPILTMGKFKGVNAVVDFLHECGHLQDPVATGLVITARNRYAEEFFGKNTDHVEPERLLALRERNDAVIKSERNAWTFAIKMTRQLDQKYGTDIIKRMGGLDGIFTYVNRYLGMYEQHTVTELEYLGFEVYSKAQMEELLLARMNQ